MRNIAGTLVALLVGMGTAHADDSASARALFHEGTRQYDVREYEQALQAFKKAYLAKPEPLFIYNMGQCYRKMNRPDEAAESYRTYLRRAPNAPNRATVEQFIADADRQVAASRRSPSEVVGPGEKIDDRSVVPPGPVVETPPPPQPAPVKVVVAPAPTEDSSIVKKPLFWGIAVGAVVVLGVAITVGAVLGTEPHATTPSLGDIAVTSP